MEVPKFPIPEIWERIKNICVIFHEDISNDFRVWEKSENLDGLTSGLNSFNYAEALDLAGINPMEEISDPETQAMVISYFIAGIRIGNAVNNPDLIKE